MTANPRTTPTGDQPVTTTALDTPTTFDFGDGHGAVPAIQRPNGAWCAKSASVGSDAEIGSDAKIGSYAKIGSDAKIGSYAEIVRVGPVGSRQNNYLYVYPTRDGLRCSTGCFVDKTFDELMAACAAQHGADHAHTRDYRLLATAAFATLAARMNLPPETPDAG
jgi:hypothetical protein